MFRNGLNPQVGIGMHTNDLRRALGQHVTRQQGRLAAGEDADHPDKLGFGMVLAARGNVYGDEGRVPAAVVDRRRAANRAARAARRVHRKRRK